MKQRNLLVTFAAIILLFTSEIAEAKIWRVNNSAVGTSGESMGGSVAYPVFKDLDDVVMSNLVVGGDTIHLEGSNTLYPAVNITKKLIIIGPGYLLPENPNTSVNAIQAHISYISFSSGSEGSQLIGVYVGPNINPLSINTSNILIKRCRIDNTISLYYNISDITILQNFFSNDFSTANIFNTNINGFPTHLIFNNNIVERTLLLPNNLNATIDECKNNIFAGPSATPAIQIFVGSFQNNILVNQNATVLLNGVSGPSSNPNISYNISSLASTQFGTANNNIETPMANLFVNLASNIDVGYQLRPNSTGSNNGSDGSDRGAFGGLSPANRYTLSGLPPIPVIYYISNIGTAGPAGLPVTIKARTIK